MNDNIKSIIAFVALISVFAILLLSGIMFAWVEFLWCGGFTIITFC